MLKRFPISVITDAHVTLDITSSIKLTVKSLQPNLLKYKMVRRVFREPKKINDNSRTIQTLLMTDLNSFMTILGIRTQKALIYSFAIGAVENME
jgi:hypothetical protein